MLFFPVLASFFAFGALTAVASPAPSVERREGVSGALAVLFDLDTEINLILPRIDMLVNSQTSIAADIEPLAIQLVGALKTGSAKLDALTGRADANSGGTNAEVAKKTADIYTGIAKALDKVKAKNFLFYLLFVKYSIEGALIGVLLSLDDALTGVLPLVGNLLSAVDTLLSGLGFLHIKLLLGL